MFFNTFDYAIIGFLNRFAHRSVAVDQIVVAIGSLPLLKTGVITALLVWAWFRLDARTDHRLTIIAGIVGTCAAVLAARVLAVFVPFRERPFRNPDLHFVAPYFMGGGDAVSWKTFPSDNAVLFFGLAMCIYLVSKRAGIWAFLHVFLVVAVSRVYVGYHYPSDVLAGALIGVGAVLLVQRPFLKAAINDVPMRWLARHPVPFYAGFTCGLYLIWTTFSPLYPAIHLVISELRVANHYSDPAVARRNP